MSILRQTKSVKLLLQEFKNTKTAISVVSLVDKFQNKMDKTTVYRILERLESSGQLHSFMGKDGLKRYAKGNQKDVKGCERKESYNSTASTMIDE